MAFDYIGTIIYTLKEIFGVPCFNLSVGAAFSLKVLRRVIFMIFSE